MGRKKERHPIWLLATGHSSHSRQPSFAPSTARPVTTTSFYYFGWHRQHQCFVTQRQHDIMSRPTEKQFPCDPKVAAQFLRKCACVYMGKRFFQNPYTRSDDAIEFEVAGSACSVSLSACRNSLSGGTIMAEASLRFLDPDGGTQSIRFHDGMTRSFGDKIADLRAADIRARMH